jgi:hypothetical protein
LKSEKAAAAFIEKRRPPAYDRDKLDFGFRIENQSVELFEIRPTWNDPGQKIESPFAKASYVKSRKIWKIYWQRADLKWHAYPPHPEAKTLEEFFDIVNRDEHACFFG